MEKPVSIIIPTYNRKKLLQKAVNSVLAQNYPCFELIIVDDGSQDNTSDLFENCDPKLVYVYQENKGPAAARNRGIKAARYDLIAFLDSDDRYAQNKLKIQAEAMQEEPAYLISHTQEIWYRHGRLLNQKKKHRKYNGNIFKQSLQLCAVGMSTVMLRLSAEQEFLLVDEPLTLKDGGRNDQISAIYRVGMDKFRIQAIMKMLKAAGLTVEQKEAAMVELAQKCKIYGRGCIKHGRFEEGEYYLNLPETVRSKQFVS